MGLDIPQNAESAAELKSSLYGVHPRDWHAPAEIYPSVVGCDVSACDLCTLYHISNFVWSQG
jgi:hypothetical protein